jgi:hypothetical protein
MITHVTKIIPAEIPGNALCELRTKDLLKLHDMRCPGRLFTSSGAIELKVDCFGLYTLYGASEFTGGVSIYSECLDRRTVEALMECIRRGEEVLLDVEQ